MTQLYTGVPKTSAELDPNQITEYRALLLQLMNLERHADDIWVQQHNTSWGFGKIEGPNAARIAEQREAVGRDRDRMLEEIGNIRKNLREAKILDGDRVTPLAEKAGLSYTPQAHMDPARLR